MKQVFFTSLLLVLLTGCNTVTINEQKTSAIKETNKYISQKKEINISHTEWLEDTKEDKYVITLIGASYCRYCKTFKPILEKISKKYKISVYFYYIDEISEEQYNLITTTYETNYNNIIPHIFITKKGKVITNRTGEMSEDELIEFLKLSLIIE